ncbi:amidase signature domain-containing protein [Aspergillus pseudonomiae]|uniref:Amidase signature domain-containing protein n=1 Tax=Aspergillus pseudonomiae TaxID=1506151 RepID=A0A5N6HV43_9EURO|nr:amidase signature domain-containing protein [Aspergillus pseudonomiae]KAB8257280.1 amidase signature domain-containing protein [Aspergillus pseudonomiae]KAE8402728.1 amidase signature domain-containing protein [Aspergillus pseudonomiae]
MSSQPQFIHYPEVREGPSVPYKNEDQSIPVFRGLPLAIGATLIHNVSFIQSYFWRNAGFDIIHDIPHLKQYAARYDPTVVPVLENKPDISPSPAELTIPTQRRNGSSGYYTSADYHALYKSGELTPLAVADTLMHLIRRDAKPPGKHSIAFLDSQVERVRAAAEASTKRYKDGKPLGPLDGVPVAVKDEVHIEGYRRTVGSKLDFTGDFTGTSWCVKKWEEAGAIIVGKTTMHELGLDTNNNNPNHGTPRNPHNRNYYCGGSSGGSGYAVGAGLVPIALGADGGGSIRIPSSFCGIWGLKPSHGRISATPTVSLAQTVGVYGPMAASIDDLALAYRIMAAPAPAEQDPSSASFPDPLTTLQVHSSKPRTKTIGIVSDWIDRAEPPVRAVFDRALDFYRKQGYDVIDITIPYLSEGQRAHVLTIMTEIASGLTPDQIGKLSAPNKVLVSMGMWQISGQDFLASQRLRNIIMCHLAYLFRKHPGLLILTPSTPIPGWKINGEADLSRGLSDGKSSVRNMEYVWLANFTGCPAINCPAGFVQDTRVPVGLMAMGEWGTEEDLIAFARDGEAILDLSENQSAIKEQVDEQSTGLRIPYGEGSLWEDVIASARK